MIEPPAPATAWPELPHDAWADTLETLHLFTQVVGKIRLMQSPWLNHSWSVPLYVSPKGLTTSLVPYGADGFELSFDFAADALNLVTTTDQQQSVGLASKSVAAFYGEVMEMMRSVDMPLEIYTTPSEIADAIPFPRDDQHATYDAEQARALFRALLQANRVFTRFRCGFLGKASPVHFFWGSFDLAVTRFSGRTAPPHPGGMPNFADDIAREAYSHEVTSVGFWPGNRETPTPIFYAYAYPTPDGYSDASVSPDTAFWLEQLGEFALPYDAVVGADDPNAALSSFLASTHAAAADLLGWDRSALECASPYGPDWWHTRGQH